MIRLALLLTLTAAPVFAQDHILIQSTTSTQNSGLYDHLLPLFQAETGIEPRVVAVGTGQAIRNATNCDGDVLLVHSRAAEDAFVSAGYGTQRHDVMFNDFIIIGPETITADSPAAALTSIAQAELPFLSRGDDSGTHSREMALWNTADIDPTGASGGWYRETGAGMGATLNIAAGMGAYTLTDRATWLTFANPADLVISYEGHADLNNQYGVIAVSPQHCPSVNAIGAQTFVDWITGTSGQQAIAAYRLNGAPLFTPNAAE
ncbi:tungstate transport system substrate-binding protein [Monaibacterium marinum]|uniref:Tungstate transport system substrate-binding protein n=1 Tax=Pontivivens marinum TaxID=1690039 RepID=A0A2C9CSZ2_9RHOB|nr:substrate-binding domain-containing protein [Monaibacterium marinum]SOH94285.1 tungstate transport system substrate-binding protein [Monaibacterium marinum]